MIFLQESRSLFRSSLEAYTLLASGARCRLVERMGEAVGLQILTTLVLAHLECEEEKAKHRMAGDENLEVIREILDGTCSADLLKGECQKLFSFIDKVLSKRNCSELCFHQVFSITFLSLVLCWPANV
mmetsp:Transcript_28194/g.58840  ORF Transcript_28194/g.58840 Transcript_28194/m.58840 type:complete len:128 (-) Transcript_28194:1928-2311(-)